jgi:hypothetical protein
LYSSVFHKTAVAAGEVHGTRLVARSHTCRPGGTTCVQGKRMRCENNIDQAADRRGGPGGRCADR